MSILHSALFLWYGRRLPGAIAGVRFWDTLRPVPERQVAFWAILAGVFFLLPGQLALWIAKQGKALPAFLGWQLLAITLVCGILLPVSGAWLFAVPGILILLGARGSGSGP